MKKLVRKLFNSEKQEPDDTPKMVDMDGKPLQAGDRVESLRYDLGECILIETKSGFEYESIKDGTRVSYLKMVEAYTKYQKVKKLK